MTTPKEVKLNVIMVTWKDHDLIWVEPPLIHQASYFWGMGEMLKWHCSMHVVVSAWKFAHPVCSSLALIWFGFMWSKDEGAISHFAHASGPRLQCPWEFHRSSEFCKVLPSSEQDEKWVMLNIWPFYFWSNSV